MNSHYQLIWARVAEADLNNILLFIAEESPVNAGEILNKIQEKAASLKQFAERGRVVPELQDQGLRIYRELIVSPWRIIYRIANKKIYILSVLDSRQNAEDILLKKLTA